MFTGLVEHSCRVHAAELGPDGLRLAIDLDAVADGVALGDSIAVNGCCLTVAALSGKTATFHAGRETLELTSLATATAPGQRVNVERSLRVGQTLGGHFVSGHVDGTARVLAIAPEPSQTVMTFELPPRLAAQVVLKGSIAIDGVSLTVISVREGHVAVALIPHTLAVTTLGGRRPGDLVNVETDMLSKLVQHHLSLWSAGLGRPIP
jgi:riboflavin synthase